MKEIKITTENLGDIIKQSLDLLAEKKVPICPKCHKPCKPKKEGRDE